MNIQETTKTHPTVQARFKTKSVYDKTKNSDTAETDDSNKKNAVSDSNNKPAEVIIGSQDAITQKNTRNTDENKNNQDKLYEIKALADNLAKKTESAPRQNLLQMLSLLIDQVKMLNSTLYEVKSWNDLMKAYGNAESVANNDSATLSKIRKALKELRKALYSLKPTKNEEEEGIRDGFPLVLKQNGSQDIPAEPAAFSGNAAGTDAGSSIDISV